MKKTIKTRLTVLLLLFQFTIVAQNWEQVGNDLNGIDESDNFGTIVSLNNEGSIVAIGAPGNNSGTGQVRIYENYGNDWIQLGGDIVGIELSEGLGKSIDLNSDGLTVVIGAPYNNENGDNTGRVEVFEWNGSSWIQKGDSIYGDFSYDTFGHAVSINDNGSIIAVGATQNAGYVKIFYWDDTTSLWVQKGQKLMGDNTGDYFGFALDLSSDGLNLAVGAHFNSEVEEKSGQVKNYFWNGTNWIQKGNAINGEIEIESFGRSLCLSSNGETIIIGSSNYILNNINIGRVRVFNWDGINWNQKGEDIFGNSGRMLINCRVSISGDGDVIAIGAPINLSNGLGNGKSIVYKWGVSNWLEYGNEINGENLFESFGSAISLNYDGSILAVGAKNNSENGTFSGETRVFNSPILATNDIALLNKAFVFPNPTKEKSTIHLGELKNTTVIIRDLFGRVLYKKTNINSSLINISISNSSSIYFIEISSGKNKKLLKLIKI